MITAMPRIAVAMHDFEAAVRTFRETLGMPVVDLSETSVTSLGAKLAMCVPEGGSNIELMSPADPSAPLSQSLERFLERRGEGLFALMLEAPEPNTEAEVLADRGLNVLPLMAGAGGRDVHPNSTHGVLIRVYPVDSFKRPAVVEDVESTGLSGIARVLVAVRDLDAAADVYQRRFGLDAEAPIEDARRGVRLARVTPPAGGSIDLVTPTDTGQAFGRSVADFLAAGSEGMYALSLTSADVAATAAEVEGRGGAVQRLASGIEVRLAGARLRIDPASG